jgi:hypothetical protein
LCFWFAPALGADTIETYDAGAVDFEFYLGGDGLNLDQYEKTVFAEALVGYGIIDRFSGYVLLGAESDEYLTLGTGGFAAGLFGTPLDSKHVDLDLLLDASLAGEGLTEFAITPGLELNIDLAPDLAVWGVYARIEDEIHGRDETTPDDLSTRENEFDQKHVVNHAIAQTFGTYGAVAEGHQLLLEYHQTANSHPAAAELRLDHDGIAFGYNVMATDNLEVITQLDFHLPHNDQETGFGLYLGIIAAIGPAAPPPQKNLAPAAN